MSKLIAIDNGHGINTAGKRTPKMANGRVVKEWEFNHPTAKLLKSALERCGFRTIMVSDTSADTALKVRSATANKAKADAFASIHYNAFRGVWGTHGGIETLYSQGSTQGAKLAKAIQSQLINATKLRDRGIKSSNNIHVLRATNMPAVLMECGFMDNKSEAALMLDVAYQRKCAEAIAKGICLHFGVKYVAVPNKSVATPAPARQLWRVQVGAYSEKANAEQKLKDLKSKGVDGYIKKD